MEVDPFIFRLSIFLLSIFVGYYVVWSVTPSLHTPLMSGSNAISGIAIIGAVLACTNLISSDWKIIIGCVAVTFAMINVVGGFMVTDRMLKMFKKK